MLVRSVIYNLEKNDVILGNKVDYGNLENVSNFKNGVYFGDLGKMGNTKKINSIKGEEENCPIYNKKKFYSKKKVF